MKTKLASLFFVTVALFGFFSAFGQGEPTSGKLRVKEKLPFDVTTGEVDVKKITKTINTMWTGQNAKEVVIWLWNPPSGPHCCSRIYANNFYKLNPEKLQYAFPEETELEKIDPTAYEYKSETWYPKYPINIVNGKEVPSGWRRSDCTTKVRLGQVVILKFGNRYAAIKPLSVERRWNSFEEMPPRMQAEWNQLVWGIPRREHLPDKLPPFFEWMTYEWKYWDNPTPKPKPAVASLEKKLQEIGLTPEEARRFVEK